MSFVCSILLKSMFVVSIYKASCGCKHSFIPNVNLQSRTPILCLLTNEPFTKQLGPSMQYGLLYNMACRTIWLAVQDGLLYNMACFTIWPVVQYGLSYNMACCTIWPVVQYGLLYNMACCTIWPAVQYGLL